MFRPARHKVALLLTGIYLLVALAPLTAIALRSDYVAHVLIGECAGDCRICGCAAERSRAGTCCCALKKRFAHRAPTDGDSPAGRAAGAVGSCCKAARPATPADGGRHCTLPDNRAAGETAIAALPCGRTNPLVFPGSEPLQHLPCVISSNLPQQIPGVSRTPYRESLASHTGEPPDPPPKSVSCA